MSGASSSRASYRDIDLYSPDRTPCRVDLSDNTNAWGMPPAARRAIVEAPAATRYPSLYANDLKQSIATYTGLPIAMITTGCGSDDVLDSAIRAFAEPGDRIAFPEPTFPMVPIFARMNGLVPAPVPMTENFQLDVDRIIASESRLIYVCSPNNPTGNAIDRASIEEVCQSASDDRIVILDEAYAEFAPYNCVDLLARFERLVIARTLSKAFGLAGLRIGYALGNPALIAEVEKSRGPYKVSALAERAGVAAFGESDTWVREHVELAIANRSLFESALRERDIAPVESAANFVFFRIPRAADIARGMRRREVAIRAFANPEGLRFTIGTRDQMLEALAAFDEARAECE